MKPIGVCLFIAISTAMTSAAHPAESYRIWKSPWDGKERYQCEDRWGQMILTEDKTRCATAEEKKKLDQERRAREEKKKENRQALAQTCERIDHQALAPLLHREDLGGRHVYVTRLWYQLTLDRKESLAMYLALCRSRGGWVEIRDAYTGRRLARWGATGYTGYE